MRELFKVLQQSYDASRELVSPLDPVQGRIPRRVVYKVALVTSYAHWLRGDSPDNCGTPGAQNSLADR